MNNITLAKHFNTIRSVLRWAQKSQLITLHKDFNTVGVKRPRVLEKVALTIDELRLIENLELTGPLDKARDCFVFSAYTGLRYSDWSFAWDDVRRQGQDYVLDIITQKTKQALIIPLLPPALAILDKYREARKYLTPLPVYANQQMNVMIKEISKLAGIDQDLKITRMYDTETVVKKYKKWELMRCHIARKTFVSVAFAAGMPLEYIMQITGHTTDRSLKESYLNLEYEHTSSSLFKAFDYTREQPRPKSPTASHLKAV